MVEWGSECSSTDPLTLLCVSNFLKFSQSFSWGFDILESPNLRERRALGPGLTGPENGKLLIGKENILSQ